MEVGCRPPTTAALHPGKVTMVPTDEEASGVVCTSGEEKNFRCQDLNPGLSAPRHVAIATAVSASGTV